MTYRNTGTTAGAGLPGAQKRTPNRKGAYILLLAMLALMWVSEAIDQVFPVALDAEGVTPRDVDGLTGILFHPFLHGGWPHLIGNSVALAVLGSIIALSGLRVLLSVTLASWLVSGVAMWVIGAPGVHIGASGLVFGFIFFVIVRGIFTRKLLHLAVGLVIALYYGLGALAGLSPLQDGVSWEGHLGGAIGGVLAAWSAGGPRRKKNASPSMPGTGR